MSQTLYQHVVSGSTPSSGYTNVYAKNGKLYTKDSAGNELCCSVGNAAGVVPLSAGGTGATGASAARTNLGAAAASHSHSESDLPDGLIRVQRRVGGSSTDWTTKGDNLYNITTPLAAALGATEVSVDSGGTGSTAVVFPFSFTHTPHVYTQVLSSASNMTYPSAISTDGFTLHCVGDNATEKTFVPSDVTVLWMAVGNAS